MVDNAISGASSFVSKVAEYLVPRIRRQIGYIWNYNSKFDNLKKEIKQLEDKRDVVQHSVETARRQDEEIEGSVSDWLGNVNKMIGEASTVVGEEDQGNTKCFKGLCPNPKKRYQYGRKAAKKVKAVAKLRGEGNFTKVAYKTIPEEIWIPSHSGYEAFKSRESTLKEIRNALVDPNINMIGVHGSGGLGKTTLVRKVAEYAKNDNLFNVVAFTEVKEKPDIEKIQQEIAEKLGLKFDEESRRGRARRLQARLKKEEKVLLVLDNIWEELSLEEIGIPVGGDHKGCKLLLTGRDLNALTLTGSKRNISMGFLEHQEAWTLFSTTMGGCVEQSDEQKNLAEDVAKACGGLPIAIVTIAKALQNKADFEWKNALQELSTLKGVAEKTRLCIEFSYDQLKDEEVRAIFLLCCVMKSTYDASVRDLVIYVWGLGVFKIMKSFEEVRNRVRTLVRRLKDASLLLDTPDNESFWMHDVVRDVGRLIASRNQQVVKVMNDIIGRDWHDDDELKTSTRVFLNNVIELPEELRCPNLQLLCIDGTEGLKIPDNFFTGMPQIRVLHLFGFDVLSLPTSLCQLVDLRALCIDAYKVKDIALIGMLKKLEFLRIDDYGIKRLPEEICELTRLRFLDVEHCFNLEVIPPNVISRLTQLEELYLGDYTSIQWEDQDGSNVLSKGLFSKTLERYHINIGGTTIRRSSYSNLESRKLQLSCFKDVHHKMQNVKKVVSALDGGEGFSNLKQLFVGDSSFFHTVVDCSELNSCDPFPYLETLILDELNNLETIYNRQLGAENLCHLVSIQVSNCAKLKNIFSFSTSRALPLQEIKVRDCANMTEIFAIGGNEDTIQLKELCSMTLTSLPQLTSFCSINNNEVIAEDKRDTPTPIFNATVAFPKIERITISCMDNLEMIWDNQLAKDSFSSLKSVEISNCRSLKNLFPASIAKELSLLEELSVSACGQLVEIVEKEGADIEVVTGFSFPQLTSLKLSGLPHLRHFYLGIANGLALNKLRMSDCREIGSFASKETNKEGQSNVPTLIFVQKVTFPKLERITISDMDNLEMIWDNQLAKGLKSVKIQNCQSLKSLFPASIAKELLLLEELEVSECGQLVEIVAKEGADKEIVTGFDFPRLTYLRFFKLPQLRHFYPGITNRPTLSKLRMSDCREIISLASEETNKEGQSNIPTLIFFQKVTFPKLEMITISYMDNLEMIWENQPAKSLKLVTIQNCESLKSLFPASIAKELLLLEQLEISECGQLVEIVAKEGADKEVVTGVDFPRLNYLRLFKLPQLRHFYPGIANRPALSKLMMSDCREIISLASEETNKEGQSNIQPLICSQKVTFPKLEWITISDMDNLEMIWDNQLAKGSFNSLKSVKIWNCQSLKSLFPAFIAKELLLLKELEVSECGQLVEIFAREEAGIEAITGFDFPQLTSLELSDLPQLRYFYPGTPNWPTLNKLGMSDCQEIGSLASEETNEEGQSNIPPLIFFEKVTFPKLERITISNMHNLEMIWDNQLAKDSFNSLKSVEIRNCQSLKSLFPTSIAKELLLLEELEVSECGQLVEMFSKEEAGIEAITGFDFPRLTSLELSGLPQLRYFYPGTPNWPALNKLGMSNCQEIGSLALEETNEEGGSNFPSLIFFLKVTFPKLEMITILNMDNLEMIWDNQLAKDSFNSLKSVKIKNCQSLKSLFPASIGMKLLLLEELEVSECGQLVEIFAKEEAGIEAITGFDFPRLTSLKLSRLPQLRYFYLGTINWPALNKLGMSDCQEIGSLASEETNEEGQSNIPTLIFSQKATFPKLKRITISYMDNLEMIWDNQLGKDSFNSLKSVEIENCQCLKSLFPASIAKELLLLAELKVSECGQLVEIFAKEEAGIEAITGFDFPRLTSLKLSGLPQLRYFYPGTANWLALNKLGMSDCQEIGSLASEETNEEGQSNIPTLIFSQKVTFPKLERITISDMDNLEMIWDNQLAKDSFNSLKSVEIGNCQSLKSLFPASIAKELLLLKELQVSECGQLVEIVAKEEVDIEAITRFDFPQLTSLKLSGLPQLRHFYPSTANWPALNKLRMSDCQEIGSLASEETNKEGQSNIPTSFFVEEVTFPKLERITISDMDNLEMIWDNQLAKDSFNSLKSVKIKNCQSLKSLFPASIAKELSLLEELCVLGCDQLVEIVAKEEVDIEAVTELDFPRLASLILVRLPQLRHFYPGTTNWPVLNRLAMSKCQEIGSLALKETNKECQSNIPALFFFKKGYFPNLEKLYLGGQNFRLISQAHFSEHLIPKLKFLAVKDDESAVFPPDILWRFLNLEKLQLYNSSYEEVFSLEEVGKHGEKLAQIKSLKLTQLGRLKHIGKQHSKLDFILQKLEKLKVSDCGLADLLPSSASFQSLKILRVECCHNLTNIFTSSTAKSLVQLTEMEISDCNKLTKVVARDEGDITKYKIIFHKLKSLSLSRLSSLTNFCIEQYDFEFPSLESLKVYTCSKMESFSPGCLSTPKLNTVSGEDIIWEGDIDALIQQMYNKQSDGIDVYMSC